MSGQRWYANHHRWMKRLKAPKPDRCQSCGSVRKVGLSLVGEGTHSLPSYDGPRRNVSWPSRQVGRVSVMRVSDDPADYLWECQVCNNQRRREGLDG